MVRRGGMMRHFSDNLVRERDGSRALGVWRGLGTRSGKEVIGEVAGSVSLHEASLMASNSPSPNG